MKELTHYDRLFTTVFSFKLKALGVISEDRNSVVMVK